GRPPFQGTSFLDSLRRVSTQEPEAPSRLAPSTPPDLEAICLKCLEKAPDARYASARELSEDLERFLNGQPVTARRIGRIRRAWKWVRRRPREAALAVALLGLAVLPILYLIGEYRAQRQLRLTAEQAAPRVREILQRNCFECHGQVPGIVRKNLNVL